MGLVKTYGRAAWRKYMTDGVAASGFYEPELGPGGAIYDFLDVLDAVSHDAISGVEAVKTGDYTILATEGGTTFVANKASAITFSLPAAGDAVTEAGDVFQVRITNIGAGRLTIDPDGAETINGAASVTLYQYESLTIWTDGTTWRSTNFAPALDASRRLYNIGEIIIRGAGVSDALWDSRIDDFSAGQRGPLFILNNPSTADLAAGENAGIQVWIGDNPTATPGSNNAVAATIAINNGNDRTGAIWGLNVLALVGDLGSGWADCVARGLEVEVSNGFSLTEADPFGSGNRKNGIEIIGHEGSVGRVTAALSVWANDTTGAKWWDTGIALSRVASYGIRAIKDPGGTTDTGTDFATAFLYDESNSAAVLKVGDGTHTSLIDLTDGPTLTNFILGDDAAATDLLIRNAANYGMGVTLDGGDDAAQVVQFGLSDQGTVKWRLRKKADNNFAIYNEALTAEAIKIDTADNTVSLASDLNVGPGATDTIGLTGASLAVRGSSGIAGVQIGIGGGSQMYAGTDGSTFANLATNGAIPLSLQVNNATRLEADTDTTNAILIFVDGSMKRVTQGADDSGGAGFALLRVAN